MVRMPQDYFNAVLIAIKSLISKKVPHRISNKPYTLKGLIKHALSICPFRGLYLAISLLIIFGTCRDQSSSDIIHFDHREVKIS